MLMRLALAALALVGSLTLARADGLAPAAAAPQGACYLAGSSGPRVPCALLGQTWTQLLRPGDDVSGNSAAAPGGPARTFAERLLDQVFLENFGGKADGDSATWTDNTAAWDKAVATGKCISLLNGKYRFAGQPTPIVNRRACLEGLGRGTSVFVVPGAGLEISQSDYSTPVYVVNLAIQTLGQEVGPGLKVTQPEPDGITSINRPNIWLANLDIGGTQQASNGFLRCLHFVNAQTPEGKDIRCRGRQDVTLPTMARFTKMKDGLLAEHTGSKIGGAPRFEMLNVQSAEYGARITGRAEGGDFLRPMLEAVVVGVANLMDDARPGFSVRGGHINATRFVVQLVNSPNCFVDGIQAYKFDKANVALDNPAALPRGIVDAGETVGILLDTSNTCYIGPNLFNAGAIQSVDTSGAYTMVRLLDSYGNSVAPQRGLYITRGVSLKGVSQSNDIARPEITLAYASAARPYRPFANDNTGDQNNVYLGGGVRLTADRNTSAVAVGGTETYATSLQAQWVEVGQRFRVDAAVTVTTGATAGGYLIYLKQYSGAAEGAWLHSATLVAKRSASMPAGSPWSDALSAEFTVTKGGWIVWGLVIAGPAGTIAAGNAQMTATAL